MQDTRPMATSISTATKSAPMSAVGQKRPSPTWISTASSFHASRFQMRRILSLSAILMIGGCKTAAPVPQVSAPPTGCSVQMQELRAQVCKAQNRALRPGGSEAAIAEWPDLAAKVAALAEQESTCPNSYKLDPCSKR